MTTLQTPEYQSFEGIKHIDEEGHEYWLARELANALGYTEWRNFQKVIDKAIMACDNSKIPVQSNFVEVNKIVSLSGDKKREIKDYRLTRYACYLIVQNGDPRKEIIALAQTYFAIQTRRQEVADAFNQLDEDSKRLVVRGDTRKWNMLLAQAARNAGVITQEEFAIFQNAGYQGLYGGMTVSDIHRKKRLEEGEKILDYMGSTELIANLFRISQTEEKLRRDEVDGAPQANETHFGVGDRIRQAIIEMGSTLPENLETPRRSIGEVEGARMAHLSSQQDIMMLDENFE